MNFYQLRLGLDAASQQPRILQLIKTCGGDAIQTSEGLCIGSDLPESAIERVLIDAGVSGGITLTKLAVEDPAVRESLSKDTQAFIAKCA